MPFSKDAQHVLNQYLNIWVPSHLDPPSPNTNFCCELAHWGVEGKQELKFQGELCFIMKQITPSSDGLDYDAAKGHSELTRLFISPFFGRVIRLAPQPAYAARPHRNERDDSHIQSTQTPAAFKARWVTSFQQRRLQCTETANYYS